MEPWLITGTGRCGTGYVARLLTLAGYTCGHERQCGIQGWEVFDGPTIVHESSWLALHWLMRQHADTVECQVLHVTRSPEHVIESIHRTRVMEDLANGYGAVHAAILPELAQVPVVYRPALWVGWVYGLLESYTDSVFCVDTDPPAYLAEVMCLSESKIEEAAGLVPTTWNSRRGRKLPEYARTV